MLNAYCIVTREILNVYEETFVSSSYTFDPNFQPGVTLNSKRVIAIDFKSSLIMRIMLYNVNIFSPWVEINVFLTRFEMKILARSEILCVMVFFMLLMNKVNLC